MCKNNHLLFLFSVTLSIISFIFISVDKVFAAPSITSFLLNGSAQNLTFNPNNGESITIEVKANTPVKFTRLYICAVSQICNGTSGNYTRYFTQSDVSDTITKTWNGKKSGDVEIVPAGEYKVMASMTEGTNTPVTEFGTHSIFIDFSNYQSTTTNSTSTNNTTNNTEAATTSSSTNTNNTNTTITKIVYISAHAHPEDISDYNEKTSFETSAGRERMALVGAPIEFKAKYNLSKKGECDPIFNWSFGDGFNLIGRDVTHIYKHTGEYQIVLNSACGEYNSISRTKVKVVPINVSISNLTTDDIQINNNGTNEINIGNWKIKGGQKDFVFSGDTILNAAGKLIISKEDLNISSTSERVSLVNPSDREVTYINIKKETQDIAVTSQIKDYQTTITVAEAEKLAEQYKEQVVVKKEVANKIKSINDKEEVLLEDNNIMQTATALESINSTSTKGFWARLIDFPVKSVKSFARIFYDF